VTPPTSKLTDAKPAETCPGAHGRILGRVGKVLRVDRSRDGTCASDSSSVQFTVPVRCPYDG